MAKQKNMKKDVKPSKPTPVVESRQKFQFEFKNEAQRLAWTRYQQHDILFLIGPAGSAKANSLDTLVYTPDGPKRMGDIQLGDMVCTPDGQTAEVTGVFPQGEKDMYKVVFQDGDSVECCEDHLWEVSSPYTWIGSKVVDTKFMIKNIETPKGRKKLHIKVPDEVFFNYQEIELDPYVMGVLIGDG